MGGSHIRRLLEIRKTIFIRVSTYFLDVLCLNWDQSSTNFVANDICKARYKKYENFIPFTESLERPFIWFLSVWKASICISWPRFICWSHWPCERLFDFMGTGKYTRLKKVKEARKLVLLLWKTRENSFLPLWKKSKGILFVLQLNKYW